MSLTRRQGRHDGLRALELVLDVGVPRDPERRRHDAADEITVKVELKPGHEAEWPELQNGLGRELAAAHEGLRFIIERAEYGTLPRFELKARRLVDDRPKAEYEAEASRPAGTLRAR